MKKKSITGTDRAKLFSLFVDRDLLSKLRILAKKEYRSVASIVNQAIDEFLKRKDVIKK